MFTPYLTWIKLGAVALILGIAFGAAWSWRGSIAKTEEAKAVKDAVAGQLSEINVKLDTERKARSQYQDLMDEKLAQIMVKQNQIRAVGKTVDKGIAQDRANNPIFYSQPIPDLGRQAWLNARALIASPSASSASSPGLPQ